MLKTLIINGSPRINGDTVSLLDVVKEKLTPVLGENKLIVGNEITTNKSLRRFLNAIGR